MKYLKTYEGLRSEYPELFSPLKEEDLPKTVPGFEGGTIDPEDSDEVKDCNKFFKLTTERNFVINGDTIEINLKRLYHDFYMTIMNCHKHFKKFIEEKLLGEYLIKGCVNALTDEEYEGIIEKIVEVHFDEYDAMISAKFKNKDYSEYTVFNDTIVIDKIKSIGNKFGL